MTTCSGVVFVVLSALVLVSSLVVATAAASSLSYDNEDDGAVDVGGGERQSFVADAYSSDQTAENERKANMKKLLLMALLKLAKEGREEQKADELTRPGAESDDSQQTEQKRGRWQGFCFRKSRSGRIHPYICWKGSDF